MTTASTASVRYQLPTTVMTVSAAIRLSVVADEKGGHLEPQVVVALATLGQTRPLSSAAIVAADSSAGWLVPGNLGSAFNRSYPKTAGLITDLSMRAEQYLSVLRMGEDAAEIVTCGNVLGILNEQLAAADRMRREWVATQGRLIKSQTQDLSHTDFISLTSCPQELPADVSLPSPKAQQLARDYGLAFARVEPHDTSSGNPTVAVYRRAPIGVSEIAADAADAAWRRDDALSHVHLVDDETADSATMPPDGEVQAALAPNVSQIQLELLMASDECTQLAATHARYLELQSIEGVARLTRIPRQRG